MTGREIDRRAFILAMASSLAAIGFSAMPSGAQNGSRVRREVHSAEAEDAVADYRRAVSLMRDENIFPVWDPRSWWFQANIHGAPSVRDLRGCTDAACLDAIFSTEGIGDFGVIQQINNMDRLVRGEMPRRNGALANDRIWVKCPHATLDFLPWHRLYLWYFERILQSVLEKEDFALPYWNYLDEDKRNLPPQFRNPVLPNGSENHLFFAERSVAALTQTPDDANPLLSQNDLQWLAASTQRYFQRGDMFQSANGEFEFGRGFSSQIESFPHDQVHVRIGTRMGMGNPAYAARDPIFYLHHCQIDRLWESWRRQNLDQTPASTSIPDRDLNDVWSNEPYVFMLADGRPEGYPASVYPLFVGNLYLYDRLQPLAGESIEVAAAETPMLRRVPRVTAEAANVEIHGDGATRIRLSSAAAPSSGRSESQFTAGTAYFLSLAVSQGFAAGGTRFEIFLDTPTVETRESAASFSVFMDPTGPMAEFTPGLKSGSHGAEATHAMKRAFMLDISDSVQRLIAAGFQPGDISIRVVPDRSVPKNSFTIESIELIAR